MTLLALFLKTETLVMENYCSIVTIILILFVFVTIVTIVLLLRTGASARASMLSPANEFAAAWSRSTTPALTRCAKYLNLQLGLESLFQIYISFSFGFALFNSAVLFTAGIPVVPRSKSTNSSAEDRLSCCPALSSTSKHFGKLEGSSWSHKQAYQVRWSIVIVINISEKSNE